MRILAIIGAAAIGLAVLPGSAFAQQKTVKACQQEWRAHKADNQAKGITEKAYVTQCRAGSTVAQPAPAPAPAPAARSSPPPAARTTGTAPMAAPAPRSANVAPLGANEFSSVTQARMRCPSDTVVWANLKSKIYHFSGHKDYGGTKNGAYMCERDATQSGMRAAKNEKHP